MLMQKITFDDYKKAIVAKFEIEKDGVYFNFLSPPSQANLRKLCWEIFKSNTNVDDLRTFHSFFEFEFDPERYNHFKDYTDRFRPVGSFLKGETEPTNRFAVELAAILVDFQPRPYKRFKEKGIVPIIETVIETETSPVTPPIPIIINIDMNDGKEEIRNHTEPVIDQDKNVDYEKNLHVNHFYSENTFVPDDRLSFWEQLKRIFTNKPTGRLKKTLLAIILIFGLIASVIYFAFFKMHCMQWSEDHYEIVDCTPETSARTNLNPIIPLDDRLLDFRKVAVCDTTTCFRPDGQAIVWYAKNKDKAEFFNSNGIGRHPETERALRPVTEYIKGKYKIPCDSKQK